MNRFLPFLFLALLVGCGGAREFAQGVVSSGAVVLDESDRVAAVEYREAARRALADAADLAAYRRAMDLYDELLVALEGAAASLRALQSLLDVWEAGGRGDWSEAAQQALTAFERLFTVFRLAGVSPPDSLFEFLGSVVDLPEGE